MPIDQFRIQDNVFILNNEDARSFTVQSMPRPYSVTFQHSAPPFAWLENLVWAEQDPLLFLDGQVADTLLPHLNMSGIPVLRLNAVESQKNIKNVLQLCDFLQTHNANRGSTIFVVGGGITQDVGAYAAATFKRGTPWVFVPTTLLSQADSCVGGKTAVNHGHAKNILGLFSAPRQVHIDLDFTDSLTTQDIMSGLGEIFRLCITGGETSLKIFETHVDRVLQGSKQDLEYLVHTSLRVKRCVVEVDEFELNLRRSMNYGHSIGHSIEIISDYTIPHGVGISIGILVENMISHQQSVLPEEQMLRLIALARKIIPIDIWEIFKSLSLDDMLPLLQNDKKVEGANLKLATLAHIGQIVFLDLPLDEQGIESVENAVHAVWEQF